MSNLEQTLSIIKPDATSRNITGKINSLIENSGLRIIAQKRIKLTLDQARKFYSIHIEKSFFNDLIKYMTSGPVVVQVLEATNAVDKYRKIMGATDPAKALEGTLRKMYGISIDKNSVHGSDSLDNAKKEIAFFFSDAELITNN